MLQLEEAFKVFRRIEPTLNRNNGHYTALSAMYEAMVNLGLPDASRRYKPRQRRRQRFFFTEVGWRKFGHGCLSAVRAAGGSARVITIKEKQPGTIVIYKDKYQVVIIWGK